MYEEIMPEEVERLLGKKSSLSIIDVREPYEFAEGHIPGAKNISVNAIQYRMGEIDKKTEHIIVCHSGSRSGVASAILSANGFKVKNMSGGMMNWTGDIEY
ncbi:rhodanese-like domain-containing protein [Sporolactobacillus putidus]|uniref:Rhodanese domain-containing protein n=1 Tax=Sporolactobacillus putidus TaxID=492735 RepID=A0A917SAW0_9BACL|nr:rhodanese-like domain-containing protein [Sporolactobacillus putidus]GGL65047.1 hypothetical protein GCM10007968_31280 [Sporolactobacillus putidus]